MTADSQSTCIGAPMAPDARTSRGFFLPSGGCQKHPARLTESLTRETKVLCYYALSGSVELVEEETSHGSKSRIKGATHRRVMPSPRPRLPQRRLRRLSLGSLGRGDGLQPAGCGGVLAFVPDVRYARI